MKYLALFLAFALILSGCSGQLPGQTQSTASTTSSTTPSASTQPSIETSITLHQNPDELFSNRDFDTAVQGGTEILLDGNIIRCSGKGVTVSGSTATITEEGTYILSGTLDNGSIRIDTDSQSKVQLILRDAAIHSKTYAPICILQADKVFLTLDGNNHLSNGGSFTTTDENVDAVIFSKDDLTINGSGKLTVLSPGGHGIVCKDSLTVTGGALTITSEKHGIDANDSLCIAAGAFTITSGKDALRADSSDEVLGFVYIRGGDYEINAAGDGISASDSLQIDGGVFRMTTGGGHENGEEHQEDMFGQPGGMHGGRPGMGGYPGSAPGGTGTEATDTTSCKGLKAGSNLLLRGGSFTIDSADDAFHGNADVTFADGNITVITGDDAVHADDSLTILGGTLNITESHEGLEAQSIHIHGGTIALKSTDDGLNAAGGNDQSGFGGRPGDHFSGTSDSAIEITGGSLFVNADGDGIDSNGNLTVTGGYTVVEGPTNGGNGPLDYGGSATVSGGTLVVTGSVQMAQAIRPAGQGALNLSVGSQSAGTSVVITDTDGKEVLSFTPSKSFACIVASTPGLVSGQTYHLTIGSLSGDVVAD